ncbi:head decoration protein [Halomonas koreensis]|uniref:Head decoration protein n=1 Tax=Halomonas koreensis TaxID=245385 RepID=A0ABU1G329_9GAMM|nr:head decoration protein [Halomonas koreensis]MDR5867294.1 head decoration protein [Halomonas koreensis]
MTSFTEPRHTGEHIVSEANGARSREQGTLASGNLPAGAVLALDTNGDYVQLAPGASDGTETAKAVLYGAVDASGGPQPCTVHVRACEVQEDALTLPDGITEPQTTTAMNDLIGVGIIPR